MPLQATDEEPKERGMSAGFVLSMRDGERAIAVVVAHEALGAFAPDTPDAKDALMSQRARIERVASEKYDRGELSRNGRVVILPHDLSP